MINKNHQIAINGILLLDKPINITSNSALQKIKRLFSAKKAGHTGSLDPLATGMLPICFGEATKFSRFLLESNKTYRVIAKLGIETSTGDAEGSVIAMHDVRDITASLIAKMMQKFLGEQDQIPPMYSAIKFAGKPLYEYARSGIEIARKSRRIKILSLKLENVDEDQNQFTFCVKCSKGTYVRTLVEEMGRELKCGAHVFGLRRLSVSPYNETLMRTFSDLEELVEGLEKNKLLDKLLNCLLPIESAIQTLPAVKFSPHAAFYIRNGQAIRIALDQQNLFVKHDVSHDDVSDDGVSVCRVDDHVLVDSPSFSDAVSFHNNVSVSNGVSVGMFEHVGHLNYSTFMKTVARSLVDNGLFLLHTIGVNQFYILPNAWISKYIFPNGNLPTISQISNASEKLFVVEDWHNFGAYYDNTLMAWHDNFIREWPTLAKNYGARFFRMWVYYLLSCAGGFRARSLQLWQIVFSKGGINGVYQAPR